MTPTHEGRAKYFCTRIGSISGGMEKKLIAAFAEVEAATARRCAGIAETCDYGWEANSEIRRVFNLDKPE